MKIVMVASEALPFVKTGGLADVSFSLSRELALLGEDVSVIIPYFDKIKSSFPQLETKQVGSLAIQVGWRRPIANVYLTEYLGIKYYLVENQQYFERGGLYGYGDDGERFAFFTLAAKTIMIKLKMNPDIVHVHDWHAGMLACTIKEDTTCNKYFTKTKFVFSIHNPAFQGLMGRDILEGCYNLSSQLFDNGKVRLKDMVSTLKAGIVYADKVTTVSPTHHNELLTPEGSMGLDGVLRLREWDFCGFLNGIDYDEFNPVKDKFIFTNYSAVNFLRQKELNKRALFSNLGIHEYGKPLFSMVSRLTWQKGIDILLPVIDGLLARGCNVIVLGSGEYKYEQALEQLRARYPKNMAIYIGYSEPLAHQIYASSDFFLMPSLFEPCGLGQMIAQRYGTLPIVRETGGLADSVIGYNKMNAESSNGFSFKDFNVDGLSYATYLAYDSWFDIKLRKKLMKNAIQTDNSWKKSANLYLGLYKSLVR